MHFIKFLTVPLVAFSTAVSGYAVGLDTVGKSHLARRDAATLVADLQVYGDRASDLDAALSQFNGNAGQSPRVSQAMSALQAITQQLAGDIVASPALTGSDSRSVANLLTSQLSVSTSIFNKFISKRDLFANVGQDNEVLFFLTSADGFVRNIIPNFKIKLAAQDNGGVTTFQNNLSQLLKRAINAYS
ncbi:uncharacterized protein FFB20_10970 [Fusarium fujikuroi]|nr:Uncharacterized protein Y057_2888 [Fusarium fujikuroi]SCN99706.1 uncharacterized protein FFB20_10970 [Fusarium fujikuroi]SCO25515.1 uncharacterized protein FFC1_15561 [Fusarium fujikuroi]